MTSKFALPRLHDFLPSAERMAHKKLTESATHDSPLDCHASRRKQDFAIDNINFRIIFEDAKKRTRRGTISHRVRFCRLVAPTASICEIVFKIERAFESGHVWIFHDERVRRPLSRSDGKIHIAKHSLVRPDGLLPVLSDEGQRDVFPRCCWRCSCTHRATQGSERDTATGKPASQNYPS